MIRVGIDALSVAYDSGGLYTWLSHVLVSLARLSDPEFRFFLFVRKATVSLPGHVRDLFEVAEVPLANRSRPLRALAQLVGYPYLASKLRLDVLFCTANLNPPYAPCKVVTFVHDLNWHCVPHLVGTRRVLFYRTVFPGLIRRADLVVVPSRATMVTLCKVARLDPGRVRIIYEGAPPAMARPKATPRSHILFLGTLFPHKNVDSLLRAYSLIASEIPHSLVVVGKDPGGQLSRLRLLATELGIDHRVTFTGRVEDVTPYYNNAVVLVFPSLYEGFGLPPLEAMAHGVPVIASNTSSIPEVVGDAAVLVNPTDVESLADAIYRVATDQELQERLVLSGLARVRQFSWDATARAILEVFRQVVMGPDHWVPGVTPASGAVPACISTDHASASPT